MSLKGFHILFIVVSILLSLVAGGWGIQQYLSEGSGTGLVVGALFFATGLLLVIYGSRFFKKLKELS